LGTLSFQIIWVGYNCGPGSRPPEPAVGGGAHLHLLHFLLRVAVLLGLGLAALLRLVGALQALLLHKDVVRLRCSNISTDRGAGGHDRLPLQLVTHLPRHHLAVLAVAVALGLPLAAPLLDLAHLLGLEMAGLLLLWLWEGVRQLLAEAVRVGPAVLLQDLGETCNTTP
jgi:hypothetical protein